MSAPMITTAQSETLELILQWRDSEDSTPKWFDTGGLWTRGDAGKMSVEEIRAEATELMKRWRDQFPDDGAELRVILRHTAVTDQPVIPL